MRNGPDEKRILWYLRTGPLLSDLPGEMLPQLAGRVELSEVRRRQVIYLPGDPGAAVYFLNGGG